MRFSSRTAVAALAVFLAGGCSADWYARDADREVYGIVATKQAEALGQVRRFTVAPRPSPEAVLQRLREARTSEGGADGAADTGRGQAEKGRRERAERKERAEKAKTGETPVPEKTSSDGKAAAGLVEDAADGAAEEASAAPPPSPADPAGEGATGRAAPKAPAGAGAPGPAAGGPPGPLDASRGSPGRGTAGPSPEPSAGAAGGAPSAEPARAAAAAAEEAQRLLAEPAPDLEAVVPGRLPPPVPEPSPEAVRLTLSDALRVAVAASRTYQEQKEEVYLSALALTLERYLFRPHPFATGTVDYASDFSEGTGRVRSWDPGAEVGFSQQLADGAVIAGSLGLEALKYLNKQLGDSVDAALNFSLSQPLWRGAGRRIVQENLLQAERNVLYAVRSFARFEKTFAVQVATAYLEVLQARDAVLNAWNNYQSLREGRKRAEALAEAERLATFEVDQARQSEFAAYNRWIVEREAYINALDGLKLTLGLPMGVEIALDPTELQRLHEAGVEPPPMTLEEATRTALAHRLDLKNARDAVEDARRKVEVAADGLKGDVDLVASIGYASRPERAQSARIALRRGDYSIGFDIELPVDRLSERNALRQTQLAEQAARRALEERRDNIILEVRRAYRRLQQAEESYRIQKRSVALAERRVESTQLLLQAGRASQRDVLEAERDLLQARNALTAALVNHAIARLQFARDLGTLVVDEKGQIHGWVLTDDGRR